MSLTALVTGGAGFIGSHLVDRLLTEGWEVTVLDDLSTGKLDHLQPAMNRIRFIQGSILDDAIHEAVRGSSVVFHQAAFVSVPESFARREDCLRLNVTGTQRVLDAARVAGVRRLVFASSASVYGEATILPTPEHAALAPMSPYAESKLAGEELCLAYRGMGLETVSLRFFNVYGPRQDPSSPYSGVISIFADRLGKGEPITIYGDGLQTRDFVYVGDLARALVQAATRPNLAPAINIAGGKAVTIRELASKLASVLGVECEPRFAEPRPGDLKMSLADTRLAERELAFRADTPLETGLAATVGK